MKTREKLALLSLCFSLLSVHAHAEQNLIVHEWGTFTSVQNSQGENLHGYFINSEPVPAFVHTIGNLIGPLRGIWEGCDAYKGCLSKRHPDIVMRLETPVMYFYPAPSAKLPLSLNVKVGMVGGWLTEFYPRADANITADDVKIDRPLCKDFKGTLSWQDIKIGGEGAGPETIDKVWLAPRKTQSARVQSVSGESEKYLFYRGVANVASPLRVSRDKNTLIIGGSDESWRFRHDNAPIQDIWLVDIDREGNLAFRNVPQIGDGADPKTTASVAANFNKEDYAAQNLQKLEDAMHTALVHEGLFADEATAMLETWEEAYFKAPGRRVFFLVPRQWVDHYLPLDISVPAQIERVMVGRIELRDDRNYPRLGSLEAGVVDGVDRPTE